MGVDGALLESEDLAGMLENGGDVWEFAEQAYGVVWLLAKRISTTVDLDPEDIIESARENYKQGLKFAEQVRALHHGPLRALLWGLFLGSRVCLRARDRSNNSYAW